MRITKNTVAYTMMRLVIIVCLSVLFLTSAAVGILQGTFLGTGVTEVLAVDGRLDLRGQSFEDHRPLYLNGTWEYYPNVFLAGNRFDPRLLNGTNTWAELPLRSVADSTGPATYRLTVETDRSISGYAFYLSNYDEDFAIYVNGVRVGPVWGGPQEKLLYSLSDYLFRIDAPVEAGEVEIVISANSSLSQSLLYRNFVIFGPADDVVDYAARVWRDDTFLIGVIMVMVSFGLMFMLIRTKFDMLTSITLFDTFLAVRILLGYHVSSYFVLRVLPGLQLSSVDFVGLQYAAFFFTGTFGCLLSQSIFDPKKSLPTWPIWTQIIVSMAGGVFTFFFFRHLPSVCIGLLFLVLVFSFLIVTWHVWHLLRERRLNGYYSFQILKTYYVGCVMALDILHLSSTSYNALIYAYVVFLFAHLVARLIDSNASYQEVETLNRDLEQIIADRTGELTDSNRRLSELTIRDPLTKAHNRLYFEDAMGKLLRRQSGAPIHLCMFDLDNFKSINDRFGHAAGDEQLKFVVETVNGLLGSKGTLSRVGGEEFIILFQNESKESALTLLEQIRRRLEEDSSVNEKRTTASFGLVCCRENMTLKEVLRAADKCLYSAKKMGRNCIVVG